MFTPPSHPRAAGLPGAAPHDAGVARPGTAAPLVGVVVPARDAEPWLAHTLASLQGQSFADWVCVVVDDGSGDGTAAVAGSWASADPRIVVVRQRGSGVAAARNRGLRALPACRYVAFLDSDDLYLPHALGDLVAALEARPDAVGAYGLAEYVDTGGQLLHPGLHPARQRWRRELRGGRLVLQHPEADADFATMVVAGPVWPSAVALHRLEAVRAAGGFSPDFPVAEDWELFLRLTRRGPYVALDRVVAGYRRHGANLTSGHAEVQYHVDRVRRTAWESADNTPEQRAAVARAWQLLERRQVLVLGRHTLRSARRRAWRSAGEAAVGMLVSGALSLRAAPPVARRSRARWTRPEDHLDVPL